MKFRFRFSIRTLAIFVTLVCAYFGAWKATMTLGIPKITWDYDISESDQFSPAPFVIHSRQTQSEWLGTGWRNWKNHRTFLWCGWVYSIPYEWDETMDKPAPTTR